MMPAKWPGTFPPAPAEGVAGVAPFVMEHRRCQDSAHEPLALRPALPSTPAAYGFAEMNHVNAAGGALTPPAERRFSEGLRAPAI